uniref:Guanosine-3',5'-bis(diphosphate) 3'-pyrophosphohydrolase MESH1 n=1 Tax=Cacopsylla melanoneura TaxID=428564 RepID=A0A8D8LVJ3_9HEMI
MMLCSVFVFICITPLAWGAPYKALPKADRGRDALPLMYQGPIRTAVLFKQEQARPAPQHQAPVEVHFRESPREEPIPKKDGGDSGDSVMPSPDAIMNIVKATDFASHKHHYQRRKDPEGTPYIEHPVAVAHILTQLGKVSNPVVIMAALLHDTVEDTDTTFEEIEREFGPKVKSVVAELTDNKHMTKDERKRWQILHAAESTHEAKLVKLADKLHNLRDIERCLPINWTEERKTQYFNWARDVVAGLRGTNGPIEAELDAMFVKYCTATQKPDYWKTVV